MGCYRNNYLKSTGNAYSNTSQAVGANSTIKLENYKMTGASIEESVNGLKLNKPGIYFVYANVTGAPTSAAGSVTVQLNSNGNAIAGAMASSYSATALTGVVNLSLGTVVNVVGSQCMYADMSRTITIENTGVASTYANVELIAIKLA